MRTGKDLKKKLITKSAMKFFTRKALVYSGVDYITIAKLYIEQYEECALCGDKLILDTKKTHLDHIKPKAKGGDNDPDNLELVCAACNYAKRDSSLQDFVVMCSKVQQRFKNSEILPKKLFIKTFEVRWRNENRNLNRLRKERKSLGDS